MLRKKRNFPNIMLCNRGKKIWTEEEDKLLKELTELHGDGNWAMICASLPERTAKQCRERYHNHLASDIKKTDWSNDEDLCVIILQRFFGNQWAKISKLMPGRTDNAVKNRFHAIERAKRHGRISDEMLANPTAVKTILQTVLQAKDAESAYYIENIPSKLQTQSMVIDQQNQGNGTKIDFNAGECVLDDDQKIKLATLGGAQFPCAPSSSIINFSSSTQHLSESLSSSPMSVLSVIPAATPEISNQPNRKYRKISSDPINSRVSTSTGDDLHYYADLLHTMNTKSPGQQDEPSEKSPKKRKVRNEDKPEPINLSEKIAASVLLPSVKEEQLPSHSAVEQIAAILLEMGK